MTPPTPTPKGHVLTEVNTLLAHKELEMLVILCMNREFMDFMHTEYPELVISFANGHFSFTTVEPTEDQVAMEE